VYALAGYLVATNFDQKTNTAKFKTLSDEIRKAFPSSGVAAAADAMLFQWDMPTLDTATFLTRLQDYAKTYPKSQYGPMLGVAYADALKAVDLEAAKTLADDLLKVYPGHPGLVEYRESLNLVGKDASLTGPLLDGSVFDLTDWKGKVVVIDFWATWCGPCKAMTPKLIKLYDRLNSKGVEIVGVSLDNKQADVEAYVTAHKIAWPQIYHAGARDRGKLAQQFGVSAIPTLFVIGKDGKHAAFPAHDFASVEAAVEAELKK
jgi:thiol-disulfide isomerase/thioredoxin